MTNEYINKIALEQQAIDSSCNISDLTSGKNKVFISKFNENKRSYLYLPHFCDMVNYGNNIVAAVNPDIADSVEKYINKYDAAHCFETPHIYVLDEILKPYNMRVCFMAQYFLPDMSIFKVLDCAYETKVLYQADFAELYLPQWSNALCEARKDLDVLGIGAYDNGKLIGLAACSADCAEMRQIGIDVLPEYRRKGIATALTTQLTAEIIKCGKVPFYCAAWCNIKSVKNAIKCGFRPAWTELTAKPLSEVDDMNR